MAWQEERIDQNVYSQGDPDKWVYSTCNICSIGCGCYVAVKDDQIVGIKGNGAHPTNRGRLGPKGENQWQANQAPDRLTSPMIRNASGQLEKASWEEAMALIAEKARESLDRLGPNSISFYSTGQGFLEDYYTTAKIGRAGLQTHLLDANTRLCTATTEFCLLQSFGADGTPASFDDVDKTDVLMLFGHNPAETGTVFFERIMDRKQRTGKPYLIVVDPRETMTAREADLHIPLKPGANLPLMNGIVNAVLQNGELDREFIENHTVGFEKMKESVDGWTLEQTAELTGVPLDKLRQLTDVLGSTSSLVTTTLQGAYQSGNATTSCVAINNLHLIRGLIGKPGSGPLHMAGQPSSSANRTAGGVGTYPAHRNPTNPVHLKEMAELWNVEEERLPAGPEKSIEDIISLIEKGKVGLFWNIGTNPMVSLPNRKRARKALESVFVIVQDPFLTETSAVADVILPAALWGEKEGTMENADRTINVLRKAIEPPEGVKSDFEILLDFAERMKFTDKDGQPLIQYSTPEACFEEFKRVSKGRPCDMTGITYDRLENENGLRWPVPDEKSEGTPRLYSDFKFHTKPDDAQTFSKDQLTGRALTKEEYTEIGANGRAILQPTRYIPPYEQPNDEYPTWLTTGRLVWHWHTRTKTARSPILHMAAQHGYVEINEQDAEEMGIVEGEVVRITSPRGEIEVPARVGTAVQPGLVFVPFHFGNWDKKEAANELTVDHVDPLSKQPLFKQAACRVEKIRTNHQVAAGDSLESIAANYGITADELRAANHIETPYEIQMGTALEVPVSIINTPIQPYLPYRNNM
ncbi:nitrate reductase catalytic subunit [Sporosarcina sp. NCCP-2716]|uniref:molybdopterin-dependent oxidoreductase n=1 Tax=Sporosarcina sp. NCCP-2716 TaxID=2943679 RepID=UPI00203AB471|nr:molybdopterin-dependent oxidoreductase [Sporosarcina sp. NCCP-2716]GKV68584.1 nitrate reductase catalytic subunit [Sporosarcina sp. NCCP-2716]